MVSKIGDVRSGSKVHMCLDWNDEGKLLLNYGEGAS